MSSLGPALVSVLMPVCNGARFLKQAIDSVLRQDYTYFELLISDDCSDDESWQIVQDYAAADSRIKCWRNENRVGLFANYNRCIAKATGAYLKFFAQDDLLVTTNLRNCVQVFEVLPDVVLVSTRRTWIDDMGADLSDVVSQPDSSSYVASSKAISGLDVIKKSLCPPVNFIGEPATVMIRRRFAGSGFDSSFHHLGDLDYWLRVLLQGDYFFLPETLCHFRLHGSSQSRRNIRGMFFAADTLRLGRNFATTLESMGYTPDRYGRESARSLADTVKDLTDKKELTHADLNSSALVNHYSRGGNYGADQALDSQQLLSDLAEFRELAYYALLELSQQERQSQPATAVKLQESVIAALERTLRQLLNSKSWTSTKPLRNLKRVLVSLGRLLTPTERAQPQPQSALSDQERYAIQLRRDIHRIKNSKSWAVTQPLRLLKLIDKGIESSESLPTAQSHPLFDEDFYRWMYPDVASNYGGSHDLLLHYLLVGGLEGRQPHALFDSAYYLQKQPAVASRGLNPLVHYVQDGALEGADPHPLFDTSHYMQQDPNIAKCGFNPLVHYTQFGAQEKLSPHPLFDHEYYVRQLEDREVESTTPLAHYLVQGYKQGLNPSALFDGNAYLERNPDVARAGVNPLLHYLVYGHAEGRVGKTIASFVQNDYADQRMQFKAALTRLRNLTAAETSHVLVTGVLTRGGAERSACSYASTIADSVGPDKVLFVVTDLRNMTCTEWLPAGVRLINLLELEPTLSGEERAMLLMDLLVRVNPVAMIGFNSHTFWAALDSHIKVCRSELSTRLVAYLGGYESYVVRNEWGFRSGPIARLVNDVDLFVADNDRLRDTMRERFNHVPGIEQKVVSCAKGLVPALSSALMTKQLCAGLVRNSSVVIWAGRLDRIKRPDVLAQIASEMPDLQFDVYGCDSPRTDIQHLRRQSNINLKGEFDDFSSIPVEEAALFLHTSEEEGLPNVMLEAAAAGLPIVTANVGGIRQIINADRGWLVDRCDDVPGYVRTIRGLLGAPEEAIRRAKAARVLSGASFDWSSYCQRVSHLNIWMRLGRRVPSTVEMDSFDIKLPEFEHLHEKVRQAMQLGEYESTEAKIVAKAIKEDDVVMEIGAGVGYISCLCARLIGSDRVYTYEANPDLKGPIEQLHKLNGVNPHVTMALVAAEGGVSTLFVMPECWSSSVINRSPQAKPVSVPAVSLNEELGRVRPTVLIVDVEGAEYDLLLSADLSGVQRLIIEIHEDLLGAAKSELLRAHLARAGFSINNQQSIQSSSCRWNLLLEKPAYPRPNSFLTNCPKPD